MGIKKQNLTQILNKLKQLQTNFTLKSYRSKTFAHSTKALKTSHFLHFIQITFCKSFFGFFFKNLKSASNFAFFVTHIKIFFQKSFSLGHISTFCKLLNTTAQRTAKKTKKFFIIVSQNSRVLSLTRNFLQKRPKPLYPSPHYKGYFIV